MKNITDGLSRFHRACLWRQSIAALLLGLCLSPLTALAQDATWIGQTSDWNTGTNWRATLPTPVPTVPTGTATFSTQGVKSLTFSQETSVGTLQVDAPGYKFTDSQPFGVFINGSGVVSTPDNAPTINVNETAGFAFTGMSSAGYATINSGIAGQNSITDPDGFTGGFVFFRGSSTPANAKITVFFASNIEFQDTSNAGNATITAAENGGSIFFENASSAGHATITMLDGTGELSFSPSFFGGGTATAGDATIINNGTTNFFQGSSGGNATITTNDGGVTRFFGESTGGNAAFITNAGGIVDISGLGTFPDGGSGPNVPGMTAGSIAGDGTYNLGSKELTVGSNNLSTTVSGLIEGNGGSLVKVGTGTLTLLGDNTYSGGTTIEAGVLEVGTLTSAAQEISTALGTGNVFLDPGTLRTTSSSTGKPMIVNVGGNYTQAAGGTLALGIGGLDGSQYDHVQVAGSASLNGTLAVSSLNNFRPVSGNAFEVLHSNGTRSGQFAQINDSLNNNPGLQRIDVYAPNGVALVYLAGPPTPVPSPTPIPDVIPDPLPPVNPNGPLLLSFLLRVLNPTAEQLTSLFEIPFSGANTQRFNLDNRFAEMQRGSTGFVSPLPTAPTIGKETVSQKDGKTVSQPPVFQPGPQNRWGVWVNGWGDFVSVDNDNLAKGYNFTTGGGSVGVDYRITDALALGIFGSYAHTWTDLKPGDVDVNTGRGGLYATYWNKGFYINGAVYGGYNSYDTSRQQLIRGMANGSTSGYEFSTFLEAGHDFHFGDLSVGPLASLQYTNVHVDGYSERGSFLPLNIQSDSEESLRTDLGIQASYAWQIGKVLVIPTVRAAWEHEYLYSALPITFSAVAFPGVTATALGPDEGHDSFIINAGAATQWTPRISAFVGYQGQLVRSNYDANGVTGSINFSF
jgi:autotransporter-associated beta strand protein